MPRNRTATPQSETEPLLPGPSHAQGSEASAASERTFDEQRLKSPWHPVKRLDMVPTTRDRVSLGAFIIGAVLFWGGTWYLILSQNVRALGYFAPHPILNSLAITLIISGILPIQPPPASSSVRAERFKTHQGMILGIAMPVLALGSASMWWNKHVHGAPHFTTWHSKCGLAALGWILMQSLLGFLSIHSPNLFGGSAKARQVYKYHRLSGYFLITLLLATAHLGGAHSTWALGLKGANMKATRVVAFWVGAPLLLVAVFMRMRPSKMQFVPNRT